MKNYFFQGLVDAMQKHADDGYESEGQDTIFGEKPVDPTTVPTGAVPPKKMTKKPVKGKPAATAADQYPRAPGPESAQR
jgi:hypothetical protein